MKTVSEMIKLILLMFCLCLACESQAQTVYKLNGDTIIGFTPNETRKIAVIFKTGEMNAKIVLTQEEIINNLNKVIDAKDFQLHITDSTLQVSTQLANTLNVENVSYQKEILESRKKAKQYKRRYIISVAGNVALLILIIIL